jgi:putative multiple sugar transport system substrate-binding protein
VPRSSSSARPTPPQLSTQVAAAHQAGANVIAYDRLITNTPDVDYYIAFDNFKVGQLRARP